MRDMRSTSDAMTAAGIGGGGDESPGVPPAAAPRGISSLSSDLAPAATARRPTIHSMWTLVAGIGLLAAAAVALS